MQRNDKIIIEDAFDGSCSIQMMTYDTRNILKILHKANRTNFDKKCTIFALSKIIGGSTTDSDVEPVTNVTCTIFPTCTVKCTAKQSAG